MQLFRQLGNDVVEIAKLRDSIGILSVYVDATPVASQGREAAAVTLRNRLGDLEREVQDDASKAALTARLDALAPELDELLSPRLTGLGRALFAQVGGDAVHRLALQLPLPTAAAFRDLPMLRPLLPALEAGRPAGLVCVSRSEVRVLESTLGSTTDLTRMPIELETEEWRKMRGPTSPQPLNAQHSASQEDRYARRLEVQLQRMLEPLAAEIGSLASRHSWDTIVLAGDDEVAAPLQAGLAGNGGLEIVHHPGDLGGYLGPADIGEVLVPAVTAARARRGVSAAERARDAALSGGPGTVGLADTLAALGEGRVHDLVLDPSAARPGVETPDGRAAVLGTVPAGAREEDLRTVADLTDWMIERALATGAEVTVLAGESAEALAAHDGVGAVLRW